VVTLMNVSKTIVSVETFALLLKRNGNKTMFVDGYQQNSNQVWLHLTTCSFVIKFINKRAQRALERSPESEDF